MAILGPAVRDALELFGAKDLVITSSWNEEQERDVVSVLPVYADGAVSAADGMEGLEIASPKALHGLGDTGRSVTAKTTGILVRSGTIPRSSTVFAQFVNRHERGR